MNRVGEFVHHDIIDNLPRCHEKSPWEVEVISTAARSPSGGGTGDADLFVSESVFFRKMRNSFWHVYLCLFTIPSGKCRLFRWDILYFSRKNEHSLRLCNSFFLHEIVLERMRLSEIIESVTPPFLLFRMSNQVFRNPVGFSLHKGMDDILRHGKRSPNDESVSFGNLDRDRPSGRPYDLERRSFGHKEREITMCIVRFFLRKSRKTFDNPSIFGKFHTIFFSSSVYELSFQTLFLSLQIRKKRPLLYGTQNRGIFVFRRSAHQFPFITFFRIVVGTRCTGFRTAHIRIYRFTCGILSLCFSHTTYGKS